MANINKSIRKLIQALAARGDDLLFNQKQFMGREGKVHPLYTICQPQWDDLKGKYRNVELYSTVSNIRILFFLRDRLFELEGKELPMDNEMWNEVRKGLDNG